MVKGYIFDLDGTLLDSQWVWKSAVEELLQGYHIQDIDALYESLRAFSINEAIDYIIDRYDLNVNADNIFQQLSDIVSAKYDHEVSLKEGAYDHLLEFKQEGKKMVIATASEYDFIVPCLKRVGIFDLMDAIITTSQYHTTKKETVIYDKACELMGLSKEEVIVFEDAMHAIETLRNAQYQVYAIYDEDEAANQDKIRQLANCYLESWLQF